MKAAYKITDVVRLALKSLAVHKARSALTVTGILFGVWCVIAMLAINAGLSFESQRDLRELGSSNIIIESIKPAQGSSKATGQDYGTLVYGLTDTDVVLLRDNVPLVRRCVTAHRTQQYAFAGTQNLAVGVIATEPAYELVAPMDIPHGRFLTSSDMLQRKANCVITASLARKLFSYKDPLGQTVRLAREPFRVVGVLARLPHALAYGSGDVEDYVIIPMTTHRSRFGRFTIIIRAGSQTREKVDVSQCILQLVNEQAVLSAARMIPFLLDRYHDGDYLTRVPIEEIKLKEKDRKRWNFMFLAIASVSLLVGGIGIMNIMLASVTERTREIGIRRALGAKRRDIVSQFLVESVVLTTVGGLLGICIGLLVPWGVERVLKFTTIVTVSTLLLPMVMAVAVGLVSGIYPAMRAAKLDPIVALRHE